MFKKRGFLVLFLIFSVSMVWGVEIYSEDFTGQNGKGATGDSDNGTTIDLSGVNWTIDVGTTLETDGSTNQFQVVTDQAFTGEAFVGIDVDGSAYWYSPILDVSSSSFLNLSIDLDIIGDGANSSGENITVYYTTNPSAGSPDYTTVKSFDQNNCSDLPETVTQNNIDISGTSEFGLRVEIDANGSGDGFLFDNIVVEEPSVKPEPSNYPTSFTATANGYNQVDLSWTDAIGNTLPDGYLIKANETGSFTDPADGTDPAEDTDLSDGSALVKVAHGAKGSYSFTSLSELTTYYFKIWPSTNSGTDINFKTDGTVPTDNATTEEAPDIPALIISEVTDPGDNYKGRFVELFNASGSQIDFSMQTWYFDIQANGGNHSSIQLTGVLPAGDTYVIGNATNLDDIYGAGTTDLDFGNVTGNGNDGYFLFYDGNENNGILYDAYGVIDVDGTDEPWEYEDSRAVRGTNETVTQGNSTWTASEWEITLANVEDCTPGQLGPDQTLPVTLSTFTVVFVDEQPLLQWKTQSEENNAGWNIYRGQTETAFQTETAQIINFEIIPGAGTSSEPTTYEYSDVFPVQPESSYYYWLESVDYSGTTHLYGPVTLAVPEEDIPGDTPELPYQYGLQNYPNPFNPSTEISFVLPKASPVELNIYNLKGRKIRTLIAGETMAKDKVHTVVWDGTDSSGQPVSSGIYLYKLLTQDKVYTQKMLLVK